MAPLFAYLAEVALSAAATAATNAALKALSSDD
jgi:hypothetical protein